MPKQRTLSPRGKILRAVQRGDVDVVIQFLATPDDLFMDQAERHAALREVIQKNAAKGLPALIESVLSTALTLDAEVLAIQQLTIRRMLNEGARRYGAEAATRCVPTEELDRLTRIENHVTGLAKCVATIRHVLAVTQDAEALKAGRSAKRQATHLRLVDEQVAAHA